MTFLSVFIAPSNIFLSKDIGIFIKFKSCLHWLGHHSLIHITSFCVICTKYHFWWQTFMWLYYYHQVYLYECVYVYVMYSCTHQRKDKYPESLDSSFHLLSTLICFHHFTIPSVLTFCFAIVHVYTMISVLHWNQHFDTKLIHSTFLECFVLFYFFVSR